MNIIEAAKEKFRQIIAEHRLGNEPVEVTVGTLTARQAIGDPARQDFPLLEGREVMIEAQFKGSFGQAFTDRPHEFRGSLNDILILKLDTNDARAIFDATLNAVLAHLGMVTGVRHCHDEEPEKCAAEIAQYILDNWSGMIGRFVKVMPIDYRKALERMQAEEQRNTETTPATEEVFHG